MSEKPEVYAVEIESAVNGYVVDVLDSNHSTNGKVIFHDFHALMAWLKDHMPLHLQKENPNA